MGRRGGKSPRISADESSAHDTLTPLIRGSSAPSACHPPPTSRPWLWAFVFGPFILFSQERKGGGRQPVIGLWKVIACQRCKLGPRPGGEVAISTSVFPRVRKGHSPFPRAVGGETAPGMECVSAAWGPGSTPSCAARDPEETAPPPPPPRGREGRLEESRREERKQARTEVWARIRHPHSTPVLSPPIPRTDPQDFQNHSTAGWKGTWVHLSQLSPGQQDQRRERTC